MQEWDLYFKSEYYSFTGARYYHGDKKYAFTGTCLKDKTRDRSESERVREGKRY